MHFFNNLCTNYADHRNVLIHAACTSYIHDAYVHFFPAHLFSIVSIARRDTVISFARVLDPSASAGVGEWNPTAKGGLSFGAFFALVAHLCCNFNHNLS